MGSVDGDVKIRVSLDSKGVEKGADRVKRKMTSLSKTVAAVFSANARETNALEKNIAAYEKQAEAAEKSLKAEKERLTELERLRKKIETDPKAREAVDRMGIVDIDAEIEGSQQKVASLRQEIKGLNSEIKESNASIREMSRETNPVADRIDKLTRRINKLALRAFIFNVISSGLRTMKDRLVQLLEQDSAVSKSMAEIKGSLVAAFMSIYNLCIPAIRSMLTWLSNLTAAIAEVVREVSEMIGSILGIETSSLSNADALLEQADATTALGDAADSASESLAAFDEINQLSDSSSGDSSSSSGSTTTSSWDFSALDTVSDKFKTIAKWVVKIGTAIAAWKLSSALGILNDSSFVSTLSTILGFVKATSSFSEDLLPNLISIKKEGANVENVLGVLEGGAGTLAGLSLAFGDVKGAIGYLAIETASLIAKDWDRISDKLGVWGKVLTPVVEGFKEVAGFVAEIINNPLEVDIIGEIGNMSFVAKGTMALITASLVRTIGKLIGLNGNVFVKTGIITMALLTGVELYTDIKDILEGEGEHKTEAMRTLIGKLLFGAAAAVVTIAAGGGAWALMVTVPLGIKIGAAIADVIDYKETDEWKFDEAVWAAEKVKDIQDLLSDYTGVKISDSAFENIVGPGVLDDLELTESELEKIADKAINFAKVFKEQSSTEGFEEWLKTLGLLSDESNSVSEGLGTSAATMEKVSQKAMQTENTVSDLSAEIESVPEVTMEATSLEDADTAAVHLESSVEDVTAAIGDTELAAEGLQTVLSDDMSEAYGEMETGARTTSSTMTGIFSLAAQRIKNSLKTNLSNAFKAFSSGGVVFDGITDGIDKIFTRIMNKLIDGLNTVLNDSFDKINTALDKIRNTKVDGIKPFISLPRVSISKIPKLAQGAVIPANNEFLAVLGDQKQGTNIEAPLDTIVEAVMTAMSKSGMDSDSIGTAVRSAMQGLSFKVGKREIGYVVADAINSNRRSDGKLALNL